MTTAEHLTAARGHILEAMKAHPEASKLDAVAHLLLVAWRLVREVKP